MEHVARETARSVCAKKAILVSIVMPTLDEATNVRARAAEIARQEGPFEWIVADGGSSDETVALASSLGAQTIVCSRGRGGQLDAGTRMSGGEIVLFLHADTALPDGAFAAMRGALDDERIVGGNFQLRFTAEGFLSRVLAWAYANQQRVFGAFFGDSAIFVRRDVFDELGGFGGMPLMEDYEFVRRLRRRGGTRRLDLVVTTSSRRFERRPFRTIVLWASIMVLYHVGVPPVRLARLYRPHRG